MGQAKADLHAFGSNFTEHSCTVVGLPFAAKADPLALGRLGAGESRRRPRLFASKQPSPRGHRLRFVSRARWGYLALSVSETLADIWFNPLVKIERHEAPIGTNPIMLPSKLRTELASIVNQISSLAAHTEYENIRRELLELALKLDRLKDQLLLDESSPSRPLKLGR